MELQDMDYIIGIIDQYDAVHSKLLPWDDGDNKDYELMHGDLFQPTFRKWRIKIDTAYDGSLFGVFKNFGVNLNDDDYALIRNHLYTKYGLGEA